MLSKDPAFSIQPAWSQLGSSQESERAAGTSHTISPGSFPSKTKSLASSWKEFVHTSSIQLLWLLEELAPKSPGSGNWQGSVFTRSPRPHKTSRQVYMGPPALSATLPSDLAQSKQSHPALGFFLMGLDCIAKVLTFLAAAWRSDSVSLHTSRVSRRWKTSIQLSLDFSAETLEIRRDWDDILKMLPTKNILPSKLIPQN